MDFTIWIPLAAMLVSGICCLWIYRDGQASLRNPAPQPPTVAGQVYPLRPAVTGWHPSDYLTDDDWAWLRHHLELAGAAPFPTAGEILDWPGHDWTGLAGAILRDSRHPHTEFHAGR